MPSLHDLQEGFASALTGDVAARGTPWIRADGVSPAQRIGFYRTNVLGNYLDALRATYRCVESLIGRGCFDHYAQRFIRATPSRSGDLNRFGGELADFLRVSPIARDLPYLPDVARLEWLLEEVFYAADHPPLDLLQLGALAPERYAGLRFVLHPACRLLRSEFPVRRIWEVSRPDRAGTQDAAVSLAEGGDCLLLRREGFDPVIERVSPGEFALLAALQGAEPFGSAYRTAVAEQDGLDPGAILRRRIADSTIVDFATGD